MALKSPMMNRRLTNPQTTLPPLMINNLLKIKKKKKESVCVSVLKNRWMHGSSDVLGFGAIE